MLYLFPNLLCQEHSHQDYFPKSVDEAVFTIKGLIAEDEKNGRKFLKRFAFSDGRTFRDIPIKILSEHTTEKQLLELVDLIKKEGNYGLITDCGLACLADPGSSLVSKAREAKIPVKTFPGPSSIIMTLQLSGFYAQQFSFVGYLPRDEMQLIAKIKELEKQALSGSVQLFIEAPYRNLKLLEVLVKTLSSSIKMCVACDLTLPTEEVCVMSVSKWRDKNLSIYNKREVVFALSK